MTHAETQRAEADRMERQIASIRAEDPKLADELQQELDELREEIVCDCGDCDSCHYRAEEEFVAKRDEWIDHQIDMARGK